MKLSDKKFIARSLERATPKAAKGPDPADLASLRGITEKSRREAEHLVPGLDGNYEPVSFAHPHDGRRIYGWLVAVDADGNARVEIGDGEYACVPPSELRRLGAKEDRTSIQAQLRRTIGQVSLDTNGVRADFYETSSMMPLSDDDSLQLLSLGYSTSFGVPTDAELSAFVGRFHPTASIVEVNVDMPGRIGLALQFEAASVEAASVEAEMEAAHGGEVQEVLDPATVSEKADCEQKKVQAKQVSVRQKQALWPFGKNKNVSISPQEAAKGLIEADDTGLIERALTLYLNNGGTRFLSTLDKAFNRETLLAAAMPVVQRVDPTLYRQIGQLSTQNLVNEPAEIKPAKTEKTEKTNWNVTDTLSFKDSPEKAEEVQNAPSLPLATKSTTPEEAEGVQDLPSLSPANGGGVQLQNPVASKTASRRSTLFDRKAAKFSDNAGSPTIESAPPPTEPKTHFDQMTQYGLPPAMTDVFNAMKMHRFARRGDYVMARVEWDPKVFKGRTAHAIKNTVASFVKAKAGSSRQGANFGIIGKIYVLSIDEKKGQAEVQFASEYAGPAPMAVVTE